MPVRPSVKNRPHIAFAEANVIPEQTAAKTLKSAAFAEACQEQDVKPTKRQAAKYNARVGRWANR